MALSMLEYTHVSIRIQENVSLSQTQHLYLYP